MFAGFARGEREVLVKQLEGVGQRQEGADGDGGHDHGQLDPGQHLPAIGKAAGKPVGVSDGQNADAAGAPPGKVGPPITDGAVGFKLLHLRHSGLQRHHRLQTQIP